ncbi:hypothetical protein B0A55_12120 [Friedmanniomyces simplex]|uniref:Actin patches distal protein 1 n=1 Tax=Friedmanniomyces simplex TaxID=329884 RepID=A0A4U0WVC8_9PEZI|nr:hypothetical protein B0A55_12120 [Friedmanniomyces simplex]
MPKRSPKTMTTNFLRAISDRFTPSATPTATKERPDGFYTARTLAAQLFPATRPELDGEDCLHDCTTCTIHFPRKFSIDEEDKLYGEIKGFSRHLVVATGKTDWVRDVEEEAGSVMEAVGKHRGDVEGGNLMLSASNIPTESEFLGEGDGKGNYGRPTRVLLLPAFQWINGVTQESVPELIKGCINRTSTNTSRLPSSSPQHQQQQTTKNGTSLPSPQPPLLQLPAGLTLTPCPHKYLILLCSQATRDARCGQSAPLLRRELERHLRPLGLFRDLGDERPGGVGIYFISHVGGHKYSANMLVYRKAEGQSQNEGKGEGEGEAAQCIWLARVKPEECENIVRYTVLQGKVVKPERQLRGGFDRERCLVSW